jgi:hypothetical protein
MKDCLLKEGGMKMTSTPPVKSELGTGASSLNIVAGIWLFLSAWIFGAFAFPSAWNNWVAGTLIVVFAWIRIASPASWSWISWLNCALAAWTFASPWIYGYTGNEARFANSATVGICVFGLGIASATAGHIAGRHGHGMHV